MNVIKRNHGQRKKKLNTCRRYKKDKWRRAI